jgi:hypothetical protein
MMERAARHARQLRDSIRSPEFRAMFAARALVSKLLDPAPAGKAL